MFSALVGRASCTNSLLERIEQTWVTERAHLDVDFIRSVSIVFKFVIVQLSFVRIIEFVRS